LYRPDKLILQTKTAYNICLIVCLAVFVIISPRPLSADPIVIHHPSLINEDYSRDSLVRIYAMQKKIWFDGTPVKVFILPKDSNTHKEFVVKYLKMQPYQLSRLWHRFLFSGTGSIPNEITSVTEMVSTIKKTPGAIGYIDSRFIDQVNEAMIGGSSNE